MPAPRVAVVGSAVLLAGDCLVEMESLAENSIDACVCDPPYHLQSIVKRFAKLGRTDKTRTTSGPHQRTANGFMNKIWDGGDISFQVSTWQKVFRVLKPGAYIVVFASSRTFGRTSVAIEDAGFITHPLIGWIFAQGFPKAHQLKSEGMEGWRYGGQALKPALEPIYVGQKPFSEKTGTANVLRWGTGAMNIDGCRVAIDPTVDDPRLGRKGNWSSDKMAKNVYGGGYVGGRVSSSEQGRWPANVITDGSDEVVASFPNSAGQLADARVDGSPKTGNVYGKFTHRDGEASADRRYAENGGTNFAMKPGARRTDSGSAARYFYQAKASKKDRAGSKHATVKPVALMRYLCRLVTPPFGTILDPFAGTGTTGEAAHLEGFKSIMIEREVEYLADIRNRMAALNVELTDGTAAA